MTPEARMEKAHNLLDGWLHERNKLDDPIEGALDDLHGLLDELNFVVNDECQHEKLKCWDCTQKNLRVMTETHIRLRELWDARA